MAKLHVALTVAFMLMVSFCDGIKTVQDVSCSSVINDLSPCISFVLFGGNTVDPACCSGMKALVGSAPLRSDRQAVCSCLKSLASSATDEEIRNAAKIPGLCGVKLPVPIARNVDCSKVN